MPGRTIRFLLLVLSCIFAGSPGAGAEPVTKEYQLKAAFIYNFAKFVEWPARTFPEEESPIVIGVLGTNPFGEELRAVVRDRRINGRPIAVKQFATAAAAKGTHLMFVSAGESGRYAKLKDSLDPAVLTVGESDAFARAGGTIVFRIKDNKLRFEINMKSAAKGELKVSAQLQKLATAIHR